MLKLLPNPIRLVDALRQISPSAIALSVKAWAITNGIWYATSVTAHVVVLTGVLFVLGKVTAPAKEGDAPAFESAVNTEIPQPELDHFDVGQTPLEPTELNTETLSLVDAPSIDADQAAPGATDAPAGGGGSTATGGIGGLDGLAIKALGPGPLVRGSGLGASTGRGTGSGGPGSGFGARGDGAARKAMVGGYGGTKASERAVAAALNWFARHQNPNGSWSLDGFAQYCKGNVCNGPGLAKSDVAATAMALLPYLAAGQTHVTKGPYRQTIEGGLNFMISRMKRDGDLRDGSNMYAHGLAAITLCEAHGLTGKDSRLALAAQQAINFIQQSQIPGTGGWHYGVPPEAVLGDTSVVGWQLMALKSAQMAGLQTNPPTFDGAKKWLKSVTKSKPGGLFSYNPMTPPTPSMTSVGLLCTQYLGSKRDDPAIQEGMAYLMKSLPDIARRDVYYWYYATQVMHNVPGPQWDTWNREMRRVLIDSQIKEGCAAGSWDPAEPTQDKWREQGGRVMVTSLCCLTLEVYYRYLPLYKLDTQDQEEVDPAKQTAKATKQAAYLFEVGTVLNPPPNRSRSHKHRHRATWARLAELLVAGAILSCLGLPSGASAEEPVLRFLHEAQSRGYGEVSLDYLEQLRAAGRVPRELNETWDLELSRSYRAAVAEAFNAAEAENRAAKAQTHLDKFLKEHADHPEVARAMESWGDLGLDGALAHMRAASVLKDAALKAKHLTAARAELEQARPRFVDAVARYEKRYAALRAEQGSQNPRRPRSAALLSKKQREADEELREAEMTWLDCRFKAAKIDFYLGQTYEDRKSQQRKAAFEAAAKAFDAVFQSYRESLVGLHAHLWHGRSADEMGSDRLALDIYDEVLATAPEGRERESGLEPLFATANYHRLLVVRRLDGFQAFLEQANAWLELRRAWNKLDAYQGVALEAARTTLEHADEIAGAKKGPLVQSSLARLAALSRIRGPHQQEAILLHRQYTKTSAADLSTVKSFDEGYALGENAAESLDWPAAAAAFERALELRNTATDKQRLADARARLDYARYQLAAGHYAAGKFSDSILMARKLMDERSDSPLAPPAASLAVSAALSLYASAEDKQAALAQLVAIAEDAVKRWPDKAEADDARIALGQASLVRGDAQAALKVFENVNPRSLRYPSALFLAGQTHWRLYLTGKGKGAAQGDVAALADDRAKAAEQLRASLDGQRKAATANEPLSRQLLETQLLLAEIMAEGGQTREAAELVAPLVSWIQTQKPMPLDNTLLRVFLTAARSQAALGERDKAAATAGVLFELGADDPATNGVLVSIVKLLCDQWKQAAAEVIEAGTSNDAARRAAARAEADKRQTLVAGLVAKLVPRKQQTLAARIFIADTSAELNQTDTARDLYQAILAQGDADPAFKTANAAALTRIRTQLVGLIRRKSKTKEEFEVGLKQVDELIAAYPNALEPKMEKGRLLQAWADVDPSRLDVAVAHWTMLRTRLARARSKPPEYYEVVYNAAGCLFTEGLKTNNQEKALQAEQLLNATLVLSPRLSGPEMVAQYKELLQKARALQGRSGVEAQK